MFPSYIYKKPIVEAIEELLGEGYKSYEDLIEEYKVKLCLLVMDELGRDVYTVITDADDFKYLIRFLRIYMTTTSRDDAESLAEMMQKNVKDFLRSDLIELYDNVRAEYERE